jgi:hypothetical protein
MAAPVMHRYQSAQSEARSPGARSFRTRHPFGARFVPVSAGSTRPISMTRVSVRNEPSTAPASSPPQPLRDSGCQREDTRVAARAWGVNGLGYSALTVGAPRSPGYAPRPPPGNRASAEDGRRCAGCSSREVYVYATPPSTTLAVRHLALHDAGRQTPCPQPALGYDSAAAHVSSLFKFLQVLGALHQYSVAPGSPVRRRGGQAPSLAVFPTSRAGAARVLAA